MRVAVDGELHAGVSGEVLDVLRTDARVSRIVKGCGSVDTTLIPLRAQYRATPRKAE